MGAFKNQFSWSWSRKQTFDDCLRRYWYQHYGFWGGWDRSAASDVREIYIQKKLLSRPQWLGIQVHEAAEQVLKAVRKGRFPEPQKVVDWAQNRARLKIQDSEAGRYRLNPKRYPGFEEHYYEEKESPPWESILDEMERQIQGLFLNPVFLRLTRVPDRICEIEELEQVQIGSIPVWVSLDVLVRDEHKGYVIIDWKTGQSHTSTSVNAQLGIYGVYVKHRYFGSLDTLFQDSGSLKAMYVNTRQNTFQTVVVDETMIEEAITLITLSSKKMKERLHDVSENIALKADFPMISEGSQKCTFCVYRRSCERE